MLFNEDELTKEEDMEQFNILFRTGLDILGILGTWPYSWSMFQLPALGIYTKFKNRAYATNILVFGAGYTQNCTKK